MGLRRSRGAAVYQEDGEGSIRCEAMTLVTKVGAFPATLVNEGIRAIAWQATIVGTLG